MNTQALLDMASLAEEHGVYMPMWFRGDDGDYRPSDVPKCGTAGCLLGTYLVHHSDVLPDVTTRTLGLRKTEISEALGISVLAFDWLFQRRRRWGRWGQGFIYENLHMVSTEMAVGRLRRFIYFKLKQAEIHEAWNERHHTRHAQAENTGHVAELVGTSG